MSRVSLAIALVVLGCGDRDLPEGVTPLRYDPASHWRDLGAVPLTPPIALPTMSGGRSRTTVWLALPPEGVIDVDAAGGLRFPPGTTADRVEEVRGPDGWRIADVRGETLTADGGRFHLLRPAGAGLSGYRWSRDEPSHDRWVHETLAEAIVMGDMAPDGMSSHTREGVASGLRARGDCARCHGANRPADLGPRALVHRGTDPQGWYVPASVLADEAPLERYRPDDPNEGPFVTVRCASGEAERVSARGGRRWRCPAGDIPRARFDVEAALAAGDPQAEAVCVSRRWLERHMSERARLYFAAAWTACRAPGRSR